ncbi:MAG: hypothetical protein IJC52_01015, partial [Clostridia bacterium]|nr:hypothetical protein [Clostridia bacterium]
IVLKKPPRRGGFFVVQPHKPPSDEGGGFWRYSRQKTEGVARTPKKAQILLPTLLRSATFLTEEGNARRQFTQKEFSANPLNFGGGHGTLKT